MQKAAMAFGFALGALTGLAQEPVVERASIWVDTVKRGDMPVMVRGKGVISDEGNASVKIPESYAGDVQQGLRVRLQAKDAELSGKVASVSPRMVDGMAEVTVSLNAPPPASAPAGSTVEAVIEEPTLSSIVYVGRPVACNPNGAGTLFRIDADGQHATRIDVGYGKPSAQAVEIRSGLQPGDRVILSDMSAWQGEKRVRLR